MSEVRGISSIAYGDAAAYRLSFGTACFCREAIGRQAALLDIQPQPFNERIP